MGINSNRVDNFSDPGAPPLPGLEATYAMHVDVHRVCLPPPKTTMEKLRHRLSEIFFPDDPLHKFKDQTLFRKLVLALQFFFPIFQWAPNYSLKLFKSDVVSGVTIASLAIPQVWMNDQETAIIYGNKLGSFGSRGFLVWLGIKYQSVGCWTLCFMSQEFPKMEEIYFLVSLGMEISKFNCCKIHQESLQISVGDLFYGGMLFFWIVFFSFLPTIQGISYAKLANLPPIIGLCKLQH